jgi:probable F420-dependent oxidoreductase
LSSAAWIAWQDLGVRFWINAGFLEADQLIPIARAAERLGYAGITLPDHLFLPERYESRYPYSADGTITWQPEAPWPDCWVAIGAMAAATERLRFGTSVYIGPLRNTLAVAKAVGTCAALAPNRVMCGLGAGWMREEFDIVGQDFETRGKRLDEMIATLPALWSGNVVDADGDHVAFPALRMRPPAGRVPILVGGNTKPALRRAAQADGWIAAFTGLEELEVMLEEFDACRERFGRADQSREVLVTATPSIVKHRGRLGEIGVDGVVIPAVMLSESFATVDLVSGLERYAEGWP